jgi:hypothetical protein
MLFRLISFDNKDETTSSYFNAYCVVLPIATTKLSQESGKEHNKVIHLSSSVKRNINREKLTYQSIEGI